MPGSVSGETESLGKNARQKLSEAHTHIIIIVGGGGGRARRHSPQKKRSRHTSRGVSSITAPLQQSRRAAGGQYGTAESSPALCSDHQSPVTAHSIEILIAASEASRLQKLCLNLFVVQLANSNIYFSRRRRHKNVAVY